MSEQINSDRFLIFCFLFFSGFLNLSLSDQMNLLQHSWLEILCLNLIFRSCPYNGFLKFAEDLLISSEDSKLCMCSTEFDNLTRKLCKKFTNLGVTKEEYLMLKAMILCNIGNKIVYPWFVARHIGEGAI